MEKAGESSRTCSRCGYASPHAPQFVEIPDGTARRVFCAYCAERKEMRSSLWNLGFSTAAIVIGSLLLQQGTRAFSPAFLVFYGAFLLTASFVAFPHEVAHALMARCVGLPPIGIEIGHGVPLLDRHVFGVRVRVQLPINQGFTYALIRRVKRVDWRFMAVTAAAGVLELVSGVLLFAWIVSDLRPHDRAVVMVIAGCAAALVADAVLNLWPRKTRSIRGEVATDGLLLWRTFKREHFDLAAHRAGIRLKRAEYAYADRRYDDVTHEAAKAMALSSHPTVVAHAAVMVAEALAESGRPRDAVAHLRPWLDREDMPADLRAWMAASFAWAALLVDQPALLDEALRRLDDALPRLPWDAVVSVKLLCLLAASANDDARRARMRRVAEGVKDFQPRGEGRAYAALARGLVAAADNDSRLARSHLEEARRRGATFAPLQVLERRIASL